MSSPNNFMKNESNDSNNINIPTKTIESRILSQKAEETCIQQKFSRLKTPEDEEIMLKNSANPLVKRTVKTYQRKVIRKTGPNGEVTEEIIESGDAIPNHEFPMKDTTENIDEKPKPKMYGKSEIQASYGVRSTMASGEEANMEYSTGPMQLTHDSDDNHSYPTGSTVMKKFHQDKTTTVTHSSTVNGESKVLSTKSTFLSVFGKSDLKIMKHDEESISNENNSVENQTNFQDVEEQIKPIVRNLDQNIPIQNESQKSNEVINDIIEEPIIPVKHKQVKIELPKKNNFNMNKDELEKTLNKLSKTLTFDNNFSKINIFDRQLIFEGEVKALEDLQTTPGILKKISSGRMLKLNLILFDNLFVLSLKKKGKKLKVIECCSPDMIEAVTYFFPGNLRSNFVKPNQTLSCISKNASKNDISNHLFVLRIKIEVATVIKDPLILTAPTIERRDQWVSIISNTS